MALRRLIVLTAFAGLLTGAVSPVRAAGEEARAAGTREEHPSRHQMLPPPGAPFGPMMPTRPVWDEFEKYEEAQKPRWFFSDHLFRHAHHSVEEEKTDHSE